MPTQIQPAPPSDLATRAAEVRRARAQWEAEHPGLVLALSVGCLEHEAASGELCYAPMVGGVCGKRYERAVNVAQSRRGEQRSREARR